MSREEELEELEEEACAAARWLRGLRAGYSRTELEARVAGLQALQGALSPRALRALLTVWLHLDIPISKWRSIGLCLVPAEVVEEQLVQHTVQWLLASLSSNISISRTGFVLSWLTALLDHDLIRKEVLYKFYDVFMMIFSVDRYTSFVTKILYALTKPQDVNRCTALALLEQLKKLSSPKAKGQILVLLGLFKSYKPECVPENIPALSVHNVFQKTNETLLNRLRKAQSCRTVADKSCKLMWRNPFRLMVKQGRKQIQHLIPDVEFVHIGSQLYSTGASDKNYLHFEDSVQVLAYSLRHRMERPAQLLSMLCNETGSVLLCLQPPAQHAFLSHDLQQLLTNCFCREDSTYKYAEKVDLLQKLAHFQNYIMQPVPVISNFLAQYLIFWSGCEYFEEILRLLQWVWLDSFQQLYTYILRPLEMLCCTLPHALSRVLILGTLARMYSNMAYSCTRDVHFFLNSAPKKNSQEMLSGLSRFIGELCRKCLQVMPGNAQINAACLYTFETLAEAEYATSALAFSILPEIAVGLSLATVSAHALNMLATVILLERKVCISLKKRRTHNTIVAQLKLLDTYKEDLMNCLWTEHAVTSRETGTIMKRLSQRSVQKLLKSYKDADGCFGLGSHLALAPYTYMRFQALDGAVEKRVWLDNVVQPEFEDLARLIEIFSKITKEAA